jgi:IgGFc binding protein
MHGLMTPRSSTEGPRYVAAIALAFATAGCAESSVIGVEPGGSGGGGGLALEPGTCAAGQIVCDGDVASICTGEGDVGTPVDCATQGKQCAPGYGCVTCVPYEPVGCDNDVGRMCKGDGSGVVEFECDATQAMTCSPGGCTGACSPSSLGPSYVGCDYYPTVTWNGVLEKWFDFAATVANASEAPAHVTVTRQGQTVSEVTIAPKSLEVVKLPWVLDLKGQEAGSGILVSLPTQNVLSKGGAYRLRSDNPVTVYQFNALEYQNPDAPASPTCQDTKTCCPDVNGVGGCFSYSNDASLLLPVTALTSNYVVGGYRNASKSLSAMYEFAAIVATEDDTEITFRPTSYTSGGAGVDGTGPGQIRSFTLQRGDAFELLSNGVSLSGTAIWSNDKPFQVLSGMPAVVIPNGMPATDHIEEVALPAEALGRDYIVSVPTTPLGKRIQTVRIQPSRDPVTLHFDPPDVNPSVTVQPYDALELENVDEDFRVYGNAPFVVSQFMHGEGLGPQQEGAAGAGDPSQGLAVPTAQFRTEYVFLAPNSYDTNYVNVIAPAAATVVLDGVALADNEFEPLGNGAMKVSRHTLDRAQFHFAQSKKPFGLVVYGYGQYTSYMYPGGLDVKRFSPPPIK